MIGFSILYPYNEDFNSPFEFRFDNYEFIRKK